jgi:hypothetical protein
MVEVGSRAAFYEKPGAIHDGSAAHGESPKASSTDRTRRAAVELKRGAGSAPALNAGTRRVPCASLPMDQLFSEPNKN